MKAAVCLKWVDTRPSVDSLTGEVSDDQRWFAASRADQSALETALSLGGDITVVCAGPPECESMLRDASAVGAGRVVRVDIDPTLDSAAVARAVAPVVSGRDLILCGDWSLDRGTGSFPAFLAHELEIAQALGCTDVAMSEAGAIEATRRLDRGRREHVRLNGPGVVSVEAGRELRRAGLRAVIAAAETDVEVVAATIGRSPDHQVVDSGPFRPRSREIPPPVGDDPRLRLMAVSGAMVKPKSTQTLRLDPIEAAELLLSELLDTDTDTDGDEG